MPQIILASLLLLAAVGAVPRSQRDTGFLDRSVHVNGVDYPYQVYLPAGYDSRADWPVILFLHGAGERGSDGLAQTEVGIGSAIRRDRDLYQAVVVFPQVPDEQRWPGDPAEAAMAALEVTLDEYSVDRDRVYLTGLSLGGNGTWYVAYQNPDTFAAIVSICGWVAWREQVPEWVDAGSPREAVAEVAERLQGLPIWVFHGEIDTVVPVEGSRGIVEALRERGADVRYTELPGTGHNAWDPAYRLPDLAAWLLSQKRR